MVAPIFEIQNNGAEYREARPFVEILRSLVQETVTREGSRSLARYSFMDN